MSASRIVTHLALRCMTLTLRFSPGATVHAGLSGACPLIAPLACDLLAGEQAPLDQHVEWCLDLDPRRQTRRKLGDPQALALGPQERQNGVQEQTCGALGGGRRR